MREYIDRETDRFQVRDDTGRRLTIIQTTRFVVSRTLSGGRSEARGMSTLRTDEGGVVNFISEGTYELVATGETLRRAA